jgi:hypothetical protein
MYNNMETTYEKNIYLLSFIIMIGLVGCELNPEHRNTTPITTTPTQHVIIQPLLTRWEMVGNPSISQNGFTIAINGFGLMNQRIVFFYSLSDSNSKTLASDNNFQIVDDSGSVSLLTEVFPYSKIDQVEIGMMVFEPRRIGVHELYLVVTMKSDPKVIQKTMLAQLIGPISDDYLDREFWGAPTKSSELAGDQISILWGPPSENQSDQSNSGIPVVNNTPISDNYTTPTPAIKISSIALPPGVTIQSEISFKVENIGTKQVQYQGIQLLSDGNVLSVSNGVPVWPTPIILVTPMPQPLSSTSYPPPPTAYP